MANADGGQVLIGIDESGGVPSRSIVGLAAADDVQKRLEAAMDATLALAEPRPRAWVLSAEGAEIVVVDVYPSVRLAALWRSGERNKIMYPVRTGQGSDYMRPGDVEARILSYGPRAQRIKLRQLMREVEVDEVTLFHSVGTSGIGVAGAPVARPWSLGPAFVEATEAFGVRLRVERRERADTVSTELWVPYEWFSPFLTREAWHGSRNLTDRLRLGFVLLGRLIPPTDERPWIGLLPPRAEP